MDIVFWFVMDSDSTLEGGAVAATYYMGDYIIEYFLAFHGGYTEEYTEYLEFCELLGLPTSDEATQIILG